MVIKNSVNIKYNFCIVLISFFYAYLLASYIPMDIEIKDRVNYLEYAANSNLIIFRYIFDGFISVFTNEPVWLLINIILNQFFDHIFTLRIIIFFAAFVTAGLVLSVNPKYFIFLLLILIFPQVIGKFVVHIRQGLAITIFLLGWFSISKTWRWLLFTLTPLVHASFFFVLLIYGFTLFIKKFRFSFDLRTISTILFGLAISFGLGFIATLFGARQASQYDFESAAVSGLGFLFWLGIYVIYFLQGKNFVKENALAMNAIVFYLTTYFLFEVTARIFESMIIIVLLASLGLSLWRKKLFLILITAFVGLSWFLRLNQPWLGWGTDF